MSAITHSPALDTLAGALIQCVQEQHACRQPATDAAHWQALLHTQGLHCVQTVTHQGDYKRITSRLLHRSGQWLETYYDSDGDQEEQVRCAAAIRLLIDPIGRQRPIAEPPVTNATTLSTTPQRAHAFPVDPHPPTSISESTPSVDTPSPLQDADTPVVAPAPIADSTPAPTPSDPHPEASTVTIIHDIRTHANKLVNTSAGTVEEITCLMNQALGERDVTKPVDLDRLSRDQALVVLDAIQAFAENSNVPSSH